MTTLEIIRKAKEALKDASSQTSGIFSKVVSTPESQAYLIGKAVALLEILEDQVQAADLELLENIKKLNAEGDNEQRIADHDEAVACSVCLPADGE